MWSPIRRLVLAGCLVAIVAVMGPSAPAARSATAQGNAGIAAFTMQGPPGSGTPLTASSPGHIDLYGIGRAPDGGWSPRLVSDGVVFSGDLLGGIGIKVSGADLHDTWTYNAYLPGTPLGGAPYNSCPLEILAPGDAGNDSGQVALVSWCNPTQSPDVKETFPAGCPCTPTYGYVAGPLLKGYPAASQLGDWPVSVDFTSGSGQFTPSVVTDTMTLIYTPKVLVIHGWAQGCSDMNALQGLIRHELAVASGQVDCYQYDTREGVQDVAPGLGIKVRQFRAGLPADQAVQLVGHSMGGLVARYWYEHLHTAADGPIGSISMLGTPNNGVWVAGLASQLCPWYAPVIQLLGSACTAANWLNDLLDHVGAPDLNSHAVKDMKPNSPFLKKVLNRNFTPPASPVYRAHAGLANTPQGHFTSHSGQNDCFVSEDSVAGPGGVQGGPFGQNSLYPLFAYSAPNALHHAVFNIPLLGSLSGCSEPTLTDDQALVDDMLPDLKVETAGPLTPAPAVAAPVSPSLQDVSTALDAVDQGGQNTHDFTVPGGLTTATFSVSWLYATNPSDLGVTLIRPDGQTVAPTDPDVTSLDTGSATAFYAFSRGFAIASPATGTWQVVVTGTTVPTPPQPYLATFEAESGVSLDVDVSDDPIQEGQTETITAQLDDNGTLVAPTTLAATLLALDGTTTPVTLHDDGLNGDAVAGDHVYSAQIATGSACGTYRVDVTASGVTSEGTVQRETLDSYDVSVPGLAVRDPCNADEDGDGLSNADEVNVYHTDPLAADTDGDGYTDGQEVALGKDPLTYCAIMRADINGDGMVDGLDLNVLGHYFLQTVPPAPARVDLNGDGMINALDLSLLGKSFLKNVSECP